MTKKPLHLIDFVAVVASLIGISFCIGIGIEVVKYLYHINPGILIGFGAGMGFAIGLFDMLNLGALFDYWGNRQKRKRDEFHSLYHTKGGFEWLEDNAETDEIESPEQFIYHDSEVHPLQEFFEQKGYRR